MLVFRCECEQVLGVEDESSKGGMGECPTCGRIIRVPQGLVDASGRLRLMGTPARSTPSTALRAVVRETGDTAKNGAPALAAPATNGRIAEPAPMPPRPSGKMPAMPEISAPTPVPALAKGPTPEMGTPIIEPIPADISTTAATEESLPAIKPDAAEEYPIELPEAGVSAAAAAAPSINSAVTKTAAVSGRKEKLPSARKPAISQKKAPVEDELNDPSAAVETKNDRNIATAANAAAASRRKRAEPAAAKKSPMLIYIIVAVVLIAAAGVLYAMGVFSSEPPKKPDAKPAVTIAPAKNETKPDNTPAIKTPAANPDAANAPAPADGGKKEEKKDAPPDNK